MKKILIICAAAALTGCGIYKPYTRPEVNTAGLYGTAETADTTTLGDIRWQEMFTDPQLQALIALALENNTDLQSAGWRVKEAEATLKSARLAYLPSFNFAPQGSLSSFDGATPTKTYSIPVTASWQIDIFNGLTNAKRKAKALYLQSKEYEQAVKTQLISSVANLYYTLLMLDSQYAVTEETAAKWRQSVETMRAMKDAGMTNEAGVAQYEGNTLSIEASLHDIAYQRTQIENSLCSLLGEAPHTIGRGNLDNQQLPDDLTVGRILADAVLLRHGECPFGPLSVDHAERLAGLDQQQRRRDRQSRQTALECRRIAPATDLQRQRQPRPREDRQGTAGGVAAGVPAGAAQCRRRGQQRSRAEPVGPREDGPPGPPDRRDGARRGIDRTADAARFDHLPRSADRTAVAAVGPFVADFRPVRRDPGHREPLPGSRRRP